MKSRVSLGMAIILTVVCAGLCGCATEANPTAAPTVPRGPTVAPTVETSQGGTAAAKTPTPLGGAVWRKPFGARDAYRLAQNEAQAWNADARLFKLVGRDMPLGAPGGVWEIYFATSLDEQGQEPGTKYVVTAENSEVTGAEETTEAVCTGYLPEDWIEGTAAYTRSYNAFRDAHDDFASYDVVALVCESYNPDSPLSQAASLTEGSSYWDLQLSKGGEAPKHSLIDAVSGEVLWVE